MKIVAFNGSPREDGNTSILLKAVLRELNKDGIETELVQLGGSAIRGCSGCYKCVQKKDRRCSITDDRANEFMEKIFAADGVILGSPTYFADVTSEMKALIDRVGYVGRANGGLLKRKLGAAVVAARRAGAIHVFDSINHFFLINEMIVPGSSYWNIGMGRDKGDVEMDVEGLRTMATLGQNLAWLLKQIRAGAPAPSTSSAVV